MFDSNLRSAARYTPVESAAVATDSPSDVWTTGWRGGDRLPEGVNLNTRRSVAATAALFVSLFAAAAPVAAETLFYSNFDTRPAGQIMPNADGSIRLQTFDATSNGKASVVFFGGFAPLGLLGDITYFAADLLKSDATANPANHLA